MFFKNIFLCSSHLGVDFLLLVAKASQLIDAYNLIELVFHRYWVWFFQCIADIGE